MNKTPFYKFVVGFLVMIALGLLSVYGAKFLEFADKRDDLKASSVPR